MREKPNYLTPGFRALPDGSMQKIYVFQFQVHDGDAYAIFVGAASYDGGAMVPFEIAPLRDVYAHAGPFHHG